MHDSSRLALAALVQAHLAHAGDDGCAADPSATDIQRRCMCLYPSPNTPCLPVLSTGERKTCVERGHLGGAGSCNVRLVPVWESHQQPSIETGPEPVCVRERQQYPWLVPDVYLQDSTDGFCSISAVPVLALDARVQVRNAQHRYCMCFGSGRSCSTQFPSSLWVQLNPLACHALHTHWL